MRVHWVSYRNARLMNRIVLLVCPDDDGGKGHTGGRDEERATVANRNRALDQGASTRSVH